MCSTPGSSKSENFDDFYTEVRSNCFFFFLFVFSVYFDSKLHHCFNIRCSFPNIYLGFFLSLCLSQVKQIEKRDAVLTSEQQINRLLRPGSTYFNLNPFEVLQLEPEVTVQDIKKKYRSLSILCHPDKNQDNKDQGMVV